MQLLNKSLLCVILVLSFSVVEAASDDLQPSGRSNIDASSAEEKIRSIDTDGDGIVDHLDSDDDNDGVDDLRDYFPKDAHILYLEDFEKGIESSVWNDFGSNIIEGQGRFDGNAFDPSGNAAAPKGIISKDVYDLATRPELTFWLRAKSSEDNWQNVRVSWSQTDTSSGRSVMESVISFNAKPEKSSQVFEYCVGDECYEEAWRDEEHHDVWQFYKVSFNQNDTVSFFRNGKELWASTVALDLDSSFGVNVAVTGQSYKSPQLVDDLAITLPDDGDLYGWRRWEGLVGTLDKPMLSRLDLDTDEAGKVLIKEVPEALYTSAEKWTDRRLEFDFKFLERSTSYATAYFEHIDSFGSYLQIKVELSRGELRILTGKKDPFLEIGALSYQFNPDETYHCVIDPEKSNVQVYSDGALLVSSLAPPTEVDLQSLPGLDRLLLLWLPPGTENFSHVRIYRSLEKEQKGELIADNLTGMTFVDNNFSPGTSYFYNLHSVDQNGKEGSKRAQVMYFRLGKKAVYPLLTEMPATEGTDHPQFSAKSAITIPFVLSSNKTSEVFPSGAEVFAMDPTNNNWVAAETLEPGKGYFVKGTLDKVLIDGEPLADKPFELSLKRGWNVIGNPFLEPVAIEKVSVTIDKEKVPFLEAIKKGWIADYIYGREKGEWYGSSVHDDEVVLPPWRGVYLLLAKDALLNVPPP